MNAFPSRVLTFVFTVILLSSSLPLQSEVFFLSQSQDKLHPMDLNNNRISDKLELKSGNLDLIVLFENRDYLPTDDIFRGFSVDKVFSHLPAINIKGSSNHLDGLLSAPGVSFVEENQKLIPLLEGSTSQFGVRNSVWDQGFLGSHGMSIAVVDSGIDATHSGFQDRIIASYNAITDNTTSPVDNVGHGTHVAGIAAGLPQLSGDAVPFTARGSLPNLENYAIALSIPQIVSSTQISFTLDWGQAGSNSNDGEAGIAAIENTTRTVCNTCSISSTTGFLSDSITLEPGDYLIGIFGDDQNEGTSYELAIDIPYNPIYPPEPEETLSPYAGVAPYANIVNVKVTDVDPDGQAIGDTTTFVNAMSWIINHRKTYNITVVNLSIGVDTISVTIDNMMEEMVQKGLLPVVAAGNEGSQSQGIFSPASSPFALTVGATGRSNEVAFYSSQGTQKVNGEYFKPDVLAPGGSSAARIVGFDTITALGFESILSLDGNNLGLDIRENDLSPQQGTSMATPHIAGLALLMSEYLTQDRNWDWDSSADVITLKRTILSGTFEVGTIGEGREQFLPGGYSNARPTVDRGDKDLQEGWGAVDAAAVFSLLENRLDVNNSYTNMQFNHSNQYGRHVYGWSFQAKKDVAYGFSLKVPEDLDADILFIRANSGPSYNGQDYGELDIINYSTGGLGVDENLAFSVDHSEELYVIVRSVSGSSDTNVSLTVSQLTDIPFLTISNPVEGEVYSGSSVVLEFSSSTGSANAYLDGTLIGNVQSGDTITDLSPGSHTLVLEIIIENFTFSKSVSFEMIQEDISTPTTVSDLVFLPIRWLSPLIISIFTFQLLYRVRREK